MKNELLSARTARLGLAVLLLLAAGAAAAQVVVTEDGEKVTVAGDTVRVEDPTGTTVVQGDWRNPGGVRVTTDSEQILVDLGAVSVEDRIQLNLAGDILFDFDSAAIRADAAARLAQVAQLIRSRSVGDVHVIGHTDSVGDAAYNQKLSRDRAVSVMQWLNRNEGIPASIMVGSGMGATRPVAHNTNPDGSDSPEGRAQNRRVEIQMATREGVRVGPGVIIAPGGVRITEDSVSVAGGVVRIDEAGVRVGGAVEVDQGGVRVGGVEVTPEGVKIGGKQVVGVEPGRVEVSGPAGGANVTSDRPVTCAVGNSCDFSCPEGDCVMRCEAGARCAFACPGGDCLMTCKPGGNCDFSCPGGDCRMNCEPGGFCKFRCAGGDCQYSCPRGANCAAVSCSGGDCACTGAAC